MSFFWLCSVVYLRYTAWEFEDLEVISMLPGGLDAIGLGRQRKPDATCSSYKDIAWTPIKLTSGDSVNNSTLCCLTTLNILKMFMFQTSILLLKMFYGRSACVCSSGRRDPHAQLSLCGKEHSIALLFGLTMSKVPTYLTQVIIPSCIISR